jgi:hypothetical protein
MSKFHYLIATTVICLALPGCDRNRSGAEAAVLENLKDPDSAEFGEFYYNEGTGRGCLSVNAKNSLGGYTGAQQAYVQKSGDGWTNREIVDKSPEFCREVFAD